jgi:carnitine 3-dehydrogenase
MAETVGLLGCGVIGGGWAARFLLHGFDVRLFDPAPDAERLVGEVLENARRAYRRLTLAPLPAEGSLAVAATARGGCRGRRLRAGERARARAAHASGVCRARRRVGRQGHLKASATTGGRVASPSCFSGTSYDVTVAQIART